MRCQNTYLKNRRGASSLRSEVARHIMGVLELAFLRISSARVLSMLSCSGNKRQSLQFVLLLHIAFNIELTSDVDNWSAGTIAVGQSQATLKEGVASW